MKGWVLALVVVVALLLVGMGVAGWWFYKRPLEVFAWQSRRALGVAGLERLTVDSPAGPQVVFTGGQGPVVMLLHGAGDQAGSWMRVAPELVKSYTLVVPDLAGHGDSAPQRGNIEAAQIYGGAEAVLQHFAKETPAKVVGNSLGAWMAMVLAQRRPELVAGVIAVNGGAITGDNRAAQVLPKSRSEAREAMAQLRDPGSAPVPDFVLDDVVRQAAVGSLARFAATADTMAAWTLDGRLGEITVPVELLWGESDHLMPLDYARRMLAEIPEARLTTIPRCGHVPQLECPQAFLAALTPLLEGAP